MPKFMSIAVWLEENIRKPMDGTLLDIWIARPIKEKYKQATRKD